MDHILSMAIVTRPRTYANTSFWLTLRWSQGYSASREAVEEEEVREASPSVGRNRARMQITAAKHAM